MLDGLGSELIASYWMHAGPANPNEGRLWSPWSLKSRVAELHRVGFTGIGLFHDDLAFILKNEAEGNTLAERLLWIRKLFEHHKIEIVELECLTSWMFPVGDPRRRAEEPIRKLLLQAARTLNARHIKVGNYGSLCPVAQLKEGFAELCAEAALAGTMIGMEIFASDPNARSIDQAVEWVRGHKNGGLFLDTWHMNNMPGITLADIAALHSHDIIGVELCDGIDFGPRPIDYVEAIGFPAFLEHTVNMRRIPGEGEYDVIGFIRSVMQTGFRGLWGSEILSEEFRRLPKEIAYRRVYDAAVAHLDEALNGRSVEKSGR